MSLGFWNPNSACGGFDDDFFAAPMVPASFFGTPTLARFQTDAAWPSAPRCEFTENEKQVRIAVDVPGVKPGNMKVELENDRRVLQVSAGRKAKTDASYKEYKFDRCFALGRNVDTSKITAHLSDGVLVLMAPKKEKQPPAKQEIAIVHGEAPAMLEVEKK